MKIANTSQNWKQKLVLRK